MTNKVPPTESACRDAGVRYEHPAYGVITMHKVRGSPGTLFGSDINHAGFIRVAVNRASMDRHLNRDWTHAQEMLLEFDMSFSQFAQFITSGNDGSGTPVTLRITQNGDGIQQIPGIKKIESKADVHRREVHEAATEQIQKMAGLVADLGKLLEDGKVGKKELKALQFSLKCVVENLPADMEHAVKSAEKALEAATTAAKIDIEAYVAMTERNRGVQLLPGEQAHGAITGNKGEKDE